MVMTNTSLTPSSMDSSCTWGRPRQVCFLSRTTIKLFLITCRVAGQLFMMGFEGKEVSPQIKQLIEKHHLGTILLKAQNLECEAP